MSTGLFSRLSSLSVTVCSRSLASASTGYDRTVLLTKSLNYVQTHGWTKQTLIEGVKSAGYAPTAAGIFQGEGADLALHFYRTANNELFESLKHKVKEHEDEGKKLSVGKFVRDALQERLRMTSKYADSWHHAMAQLAMPSAAPHALSCLYELVDEIWSLAGDKSYDMNWYTKRISLALVYKSTELYMIQDKSEDFINTWEFMDRRLEDIANIGSVVTSLGDISTNISAQTCSSALNVFRNITGLNSRNR